MPEVKAGIKSAEFIEITIIEYYAQPNTCGPSEDYSGIVDFIVIQKVTSVSENPQVLITDTGPDKDFQQAKLPGHMVLIGETKALTFSYRDLITED